MSLPLKQAIKDRQHNKTLNPDQLDALLSMQKTIEKKETKSSRKHWHYAAAASFIIAIVTLALSMTLTIPRDSDKISTIAAEVVQNHLHMKPLEVSSNQLKPIQDYFTRLAFLPVESSYLKQINLDLLGARYCSLQDITAAQLRFKKKASSELHTLYQVGYNPEIFSKLPNYDKGEKPVSVYDSGIKVTLWVEKDILFALTEEE